MENTYRIWSESATYGIDLCKVCPNLSYILSKNCKQMAFPICVGTFLRCLLYSVYLLTTHERNHL